MSWFPYLLAGGFLKGYRTYILAGVAVITAGASFAVGDINLNELVAILTTNLSIATTRAAVAS